MNTRAEKPLVAAREMLDEALEDLALAYDIPERLWLAGVKALVASALCDFERARKQAENEPPTPTGERSEPPRRGSMATE